MSLPLHGRFKAYDKISFFSVCIFARIFQWSVGPCKVSRQNLCDGWIPVDSISGRQPHGQKILLMVGYQCRVDHIFEDFWCLMFDFGSIDWCIFGISIAVSGSNFSASVLLLTLICSVRSSKYGGGCIIKTLQLCWCGNNGIFSRWILWGESNQFVYSEFLWKSVCYLF